MVHTAQHHDTVTVYSFRVFDLEAREMRPAPCKATRESIAALRHAELLPSTAEDVPREVVDPRGCFKRMPTGWGALD
jgi:hypothetical protein